MTPIPEVQEPIELHLRLLPGGKMEISAPKDASMVLFMLSKLLETLSPHVKFEQTDSCILIPNIPIPKGDLNGLMRKQNG